MQANKDMEMRYDANRLLSSGQKLPELLGD